MSSLGLLGYGYTGQRVNFNGNNTNPTTFQLPRDPGGAQGIAVFLNQALVDENDYSLVGLNLTTNFPVRLGMKLKVIYLGLVAPLGIPASSNVDWTNIVNVPATIYAQNRSALVHLLHPSIDGGWRDIYRAGWVPAYHNQLWGGSNWGCEMIDELTGTWKKFEVATCSLDDSTIATQGSSSAQVGLSQGFVVSESFTPTAVWIKVAKNANPTDNLQLQIWSDDGTGKPSAALGSAASIPARRINTNSTTKTTWMQVPAFYPALVAGVQYHLVYTRSGAIDATNYYILKGNNFKRYPYGNYCAYNGTTWTANTSFVSCFMIQGPTANTLLQTGGTYGNAKLAFVPPTAKNNQQRLLRNDMRNFYDGRNFTAVIRGGTWAKGATIAEFGNASATDRIQITTNVSTGVPVVNLYDTNGNLFTVSGAVDVSTITSDIIISARTVGDGSDYLKMFINGSASGASLTGQTFVMDPFLRDSGTAYIGGGFAAAPAWTGMTFATLPSAQGWTFASPSGLTEAATYSVAGNKLYSNRGGFGTTGDGYYTKTVTLSNATGWSFETKARVTSSSGNSGLVNGFSFQISDGTKIVSLTIQDKFIQAGYTTNLISYLGDFAAGENTFLVTGKGSDFYVFINNKLVIDGTGLMVDTSALNRILIGDISQVSAENVDAVISTVKYATTGLYLPMATTGNISEYAYFNGDRTALAAPLWNNSTQLSVKELCGMTRGYVNEIKQTEGRYGVVGSSNFTNTTPVQIGETTSWLFGSKFDGNFGGSGLNSVAMNSYFYGYCDGANIRDSSLLAGSSQAQWNNYSLSLANDAGYLGLHNFYVALAVDGSGTHTSRWRKMRITTTDY